MTGTIQAPASLSADDDASALGSHVASEVVVAFATTSWPVSLHTTGTEHVPELVELEKVATHSSHGTPGLTRSGPELELWSQSCATSPGSPVGVADVAAPSAQPVQPWHGPQPRSDVRVGMMDTKEPAGQVAWVPLHSVLV